MLSLEAVVVWGVLRWRQRGAQSRDGPGFGVDEPFTVLWGDAVALGLPVMRFPALKEASVFLLGNSRPYL